MTGEAFCIGAIEREVLPLRAQLILKEAEHESQLAEATAALTDAFSKLVEEKLAALQSTVTALELSLHQSRPLNSYVDIASVPSSAPSPSAPKHPKSSLDAHMSEHIPLPPKTCAASVPDSVPQHKLR